MKILITGITGFVGNHLEQMLIDKDYNITGLIRSKKHSLNPKTQLLLVDDIKACNFKELTKGFDVVVHLAALVHQPNEKDFEKYKEVNTDVTVNISKACVENRVKKLIVISTCAVYSGKQNNVYSEKDIVSPSSPYGLSKLNATKKITRLLKDTNVSYFILRPNLIYGKNGKGNYRSLVNFINKLGVLPFSQATEKRSYVSVYNLCDFILYLLENNIESGIYNVSDNHDLSTKELCELIAKAQNKKISQLPVPKWVMKIVFKSIGKKDHYEKIYGEFRLNVDKAIATGWKPSPIDCRNFEL